MSRDKIKEVAIQHFNHYGYRGTSLSKIAAEVGIRKQSLAYHFPNKCELFQNVYKEVVEKEINFVQNYFQENQDKQLDEQLYNFLSLHKERFLSDHNATLMLTTTLQTPEGIPKDILEAPYRFIRILTETLKSCFQKESFRLSAEDCALAFVTLIDGLNIQLVYEDKERYERLQKITWDIFWSGIQK